MPHFKVNRLFKTPPLKKKKHTLYVFEGHLVPRHRRSKYSVTCKEDVDYGAVANHFNSIMDTNVPFPHSPGTCKSITKRDQDMSFWKAWIYMYFYLGQLLKGICVPAGHFDGIYEVYCVRELSKNCHSWFSSTLSYLKRVLNPSLSLSPSNRKLYRYFEMCHPFCANVPSCPIVKACRRKSKDNSYFDSRN